MSNVPINTEQPGFMGRDKVVPFIGQVENVNDKKYSNRVQVRIVGLHPWKKNGGKEDSLKTEDLPWARVGFPSTMSQQARVGGTHGMQPGAWVYGVFLDGADAQEPLVICSFNHTAKASDQYNRQNVYDDEEGESESVQQGMTKQNNNPMNSNAGIRSWKLSMAALLKRINGRSISQVIVSKFVIITVERKPLSISIPSVV